MNKIVVTGSNGLLGQTLVNLLLTQQEKYEVYAFSRGENRSDIKNLNYYNIDLTNKTKLKKLLLEINPDFIVHTAAMTNVDECEKYPEKCNELNIDVVQYLTDISKDLSIHLIHISTDFIFDGKKGYYKETDTPNPLSVYGLSKLKAETILQNSTINYTILRTILVYGKVANMPRNNIVLWVKEMLENKKEITIVDDQYRMPTYVEELAKACILSIDKKATGIFNISSSELLSIYQIAQQIATAYHLDASYIKAISTNTLNQRAKRPVKTGFDLTKTQKILGFAPKKFSEDLQNFMKSNN